MSNATNIISMTSYAQELGSVQAQLFLERLRLEAESDPGLRDNPKQKLQWISEQLDAERFAVEEKLPEEMVVANRVGLETSLAALKDEEGAELLGEVIEAGVPVFMKALVGCMPTIMEALSESAPAIMESMAQMQGLAEQFEEQFEADLA